jgi:hypothetical protein
MRLWRLLPLAVLAIGLSACAGTQLGSGKNAFSVVTTEHFTLYTDLEPARAEEQGLRLEQLLFALRETAWESKDDLPLKMNVIMFANPNDFDRYGYRKIDGYAVPEELYEPWIVLSAPRFGEDYRVVAHELTHAMAYQSISHMPRWTSEGLACYFESAHFHDDGSFQVGAVPKLLFLGLHKYGWDRPSQLLSGHGSGIDYKFYASSWLLVHYSMTRQADAFVVSSLTQFSLTARLAFLVVGPMIDLKLFAMQVGTFGRGFAVRFAPTTFVLAILMSVLIGAVLL